MNEIMVEFPDFLSAVEGQRKIHSTEKKQREERVVKLLILFE